MTVSIQVLHVDDDRSFGDLTATFLDRIHDRIEVHTETSAAAALEMLEESSIDCIVSDHDMPGMNGLEFLDAVRSEYPELPFILFTGKGSEEIASRAISADVTDYLQKDSGTEQYTLLANRITNAVERFRSQQTAKRRKRRLETLTSNLPGIVYRCRNDPDWPMEYLEGECERLTGYSPTRIENDSITWGNDIVHPDDRNSVYETVQSALEDRDHFERRYRIRTAGNETKWVWERGRGVFDDEGELKALEGFITDNTEFKERERERRRNERRFRAVFDDPNVLVGLLSPDGTVLEGNQTAISYVDIEPEDVRGEPFWETPWWTGQQRSTVEEWVRRAKSGEYVEYESEHVAADGSTAIVEGSFRPVTDEHGSVTTVIVSARDITEQRNRERELRHRNETMDEFASFVSHDLKTPIATVEGRLELALETGNIDHIEKAIDGVERIDELREDIVSVLRTGRIVSETEAIGLERTFEQVWKTVDPPEPASFTVTDSIRIDGNPNAVRRMIENLLGNSVEHGGTDVHVRIGRLENGFYYEDDGPGIDPCHREEVFRPGFSTKEDEHGTGMGLASVRQVVVSHGWEIDVTDGRVLEGARFEIRTK